MLLKGNDANFQAFAYLWGTLSPGRLVKEREWVQSYSLVLTETKAPCADEKRDILCFMGVNR